MDPRPVALYNPASSASRKPILPLALLALGAGLEGSHPYAIVDGNLETDPVARLDAVLGHGPAVLGVTAMPGPQTADAVPVVRALKARRPELTVVWGGYFPTQHPKTVLASPLADFVVRGHGDEVFPRFLAGETRMPGLASREDPDSPVAAVPKLADLPPLPFHRLSVERYVRPTFLGSRTLGYHSSYGCPFTCNFCAVVSMVEGRYNAQSAEQVASVFGEYQRRWGVNAVELYDNNFFVSESRCKELADRVRPLGIAWWGEGRIDTLLRFSDATWQAMRDGGLRMVFMGAESGSAETLARMNKGGTLTPEMTLDLVERMGKLGVVPELSFVLGSPPDPEADVEGTLAFIRRVKARNPRTEIILYLYTPEPVEGELFDAAKNAGFHWPTTLEEWADPVWSDVVQRRSARLPWVDEGLRTRLQDFERVLNARHPTSTDRRLSGPRRWLLEGAASWRWRTRFYRYPVELAVLQKVMRYQRPETSGF